jgi:MATE family multidrug resistance protein
MTAAAPSTWLVRLPLAYYLGHILWREASGVWVAMLVSQALQAGVMWYLFQFKDWGRFGMRSSAPCKRKGAVAS